jgi:hypothetical protein
MPELISDRKGFTCECGVRNDFPDYVKDHWGVRLVYSCACKRQYVVHEGRVSMIARVESDYVESDAFGD